MNIEPIAYFRSPFSSKFGIPRQSGIATDVPGRIEFVPEYRHAEAVRGLEAFDYLWLIWEFSAAHSPAPHPSGQDSPQDAPTRHALTVRPPRLGGNERIGVFASRSPFRPNRLGLSSVRIERIDADGPVIHVRGADLMDGTPIYDIKPYVAYADAHPDARSGFVDQTTWKGLRVEVAEEADCPLPPEEQQTLLSVLALDPRPRYQDDPQRVYGMPYDGYDVRFKVRDGVLRIERFVKL